MYAGGHCSSSMFQGRTLGNPPNYRLSNPLANKQATKAQLARMNGPIIIVLGLEVI